MQRGCCAFPFALADHLSLKSVRSDVTELNWHDLVFDELANGQFSSNAL